MLIICDGGYQPDLLGRRTAVYGFVVTDAGRILHQEYGVVCRGPAAGCQMAELGAIFAALRWLVTCGYAPAHVVLKSDREDVVFALTGRRRSRLRRGGVTLLRKTERLLVRLKRMGCDVQVVHTPRSGTRPADRLCWKAYAKTPPGGRRPVGYFLRPGLEAAD